LEKETDLPNEFETAKFLLDKLNVTEPFIVDGGACKGNAVIESLKLWSKCTIHTFEARPDLCEGLQKKFREHTNVVVHNNLLGEANKRMKFNVMYNVGTGSVLPPSEKAKQYHHDKVEIQDVIKLNCVQLDGMFKKIDLLKLDIHGAELPTLLGASKLLPDIKVIIIETLFYEAFVGQALFYKLAEFLYTQGFRIFDLFNLEQKPYQRVGGCDALYINSKLFPEL
jgi:FkbM family methyltransferase